jgi:hypothetical protein
MCSVTEVALLPTAVVFESIPEKVAYSGVSISGVLVEYS